MAYAMVYPEPEKGGRGKRSGLPDSLGVGRGQATNLISDCRAVLRHSRELAEDVLRDIIRFIMGANLQRRDLNPGQKAALVLDASGDLEAAEAKERMQDAGAHGKEGAEGSRKPLPRHRGRLSRRRIRSPPYDGRASRGGLM